MTKISVHQRKARDFIQREDWGNALSELQRMLAADGENPTLHNQIGDVYLRKEDVASACQHFERAIDLYAEVGLHNNAVALCKKIMRLRPSRFEIRYRLARLRLDQGFRTESAVFFADYLEHAPTEGDTVDTLEAHCREMIDLLPDDAPVGKMLEKLENARRFAAAFELVRKLAQRAADAGDDAAAGRFAEKMRSLRILVERSGGRDLLADLALPAREPAAAVASAPPGASSTMEDPLALGEAAANLFVDEAAPASASTARPAEATPVPEPSASPLEPNVLPADFGAEDLQPPALAIAKTEPAACETATPLTAEAGLDFGLVDLPALDFAMDGALAASEPAALLPGAEADLPDSLSAPAEQLEESARMPEYDLPETTFADLVRDLGESIVAPEFAAPPSAEVPRIEDVPLDEDRPGNEQLPPREELPVSVSAATVDAAFLETFADLVPLAPPLAAMPPAPASSAGSLRDIPVWIPEGEAAMPPSGPPPDAVARLDLESVIDSFREQMARALDGDGAARYDLGVAYFEMGLYNEALAEFEAAARCPGLEVQSYEMLAACLLATGRHAEVVELLVPLLAADGHAPRGRIGLQYSLGLAYEVLGDADQARRCFEEVALVDIEFKDVQARLQRL